MYLTLLASIYLTRKMIILHYVNILLNISFRVTLSLRNYIYMFCFLQIIHKMIDVLSEEAKSCTKNDYRRFSLIDIQLIFSTIFAMVREPYYISIDMLVSS